MVRLVMMMIWMPLLLGGAMSSAVDIVGRTGSPLISRGPAGARARYSLVQKRFVAYLAPWTAHASLNQLCLSTVGPEQPARAAHSRVGLLSCLQLSVMK
jgi:hypothetical protein